MDKNSNEHVWVESLWTTRKESITVKVGDDEVTREISLGMTVKSDNRTPSSVLHEKLDQALSKLIEEEKDRWLTQELMKREKAHLKESIKGMDELIDGAHEEDEDDIVKVNPGNGRGRPVMNKSSENVHLMF